MNSAWAYNQMLEEKVEDLENKIINLEQENFDLRNKLNTEEECCMMVKKISFDYLINALIINYIRKCVLTANGIGKN